MYQGMEGKLIKKKLLYIFGVIVLFDLIIYLAFPGAVYNLSMKVESAIAGLSEKEIKIDGHTIFYFEGGKGEAVLLLHGFSADKENWIRFAKHLTGNYHVVAPDLPGFGKSSRISSENYNQVMQAERLDKFIQAIGIKKFHIAGNSMGGGIAFTYATLHPEKILSLGLLAPGLIKEPIQSEAKALMAQGKNPLVVKSRDAYDRMLGMVFVDRPFIPGRVENYLADKAIANADFNQKIFNDLRNKDYFLNDYMGKIKARTLILWGDSDRVLHHSSVGVLEKGIADHTTVIMKNCGHCPMIERPGETAEHYVKFIKGVNKQEGPAADKKKI
jgi:abhydrolase domain-containing protein 6